MNLSDRQLQAAGLLARGLSVRKVAEAVEVNKSTISNWKKLDAFQGAIEDCRKSVRDGAVKAVGLRAGESVGHFVGQIERLKFKALTTIEKILDDDEESPRIKVNAARIAGKWCGLELPEARIESQLDKLQQKMSPEAYHALILALAEDSPASARKNDARFN